MKYSGVYLVKFEAMSDEPHWTCGNIKIQCYTCSTIHTIHVPDTFHQTVLSVILYSITQNNHFIRCVVKMKKKYDSKKAVNVSGVHTSLRGQCICAYHSWQYRHTWTPWPRKRHAHMMTLNAGFWRLSFMVKLKTTREKKTWVDVVVTGAYL